MANFVQQLNIEGSTYDLHDSEFIVDTRTASGAALTGVSKAPALFDGMQITFWMNYAAASNATLNLTLADGTTTGALPCYYSGTTRLGTNYAAGNAIRFIYRENVTIGTTTIAAGWWSDANYSVSDTNYDIVGTSIPIKTRLNAYCLCAMVDTNGTIAKQTRTVGAGTYWRINAFTQASGTAQTKKLIPNQGYFPGKLFYFTGSAAVTGEDAVSGTISASTNNMDLRYTVNGSSSANIGVTGAPFFLVGSIGNDGLFYPNGHASEAVDNWWQCGFPTDLTSTYVYWYVGMMTSKYQCRLSDHNWMLRSDGTKWIVFDPSKSVDWSSITGKPSTFTPSSHTHGYISNQGAITTTATISSGDRLIIADATGSNTGELAASSITFGSSTTTYLRNDGTWGTVDSDDHMLVMTGTPTGSLLDPVATTTTWLDFQTAITNHDRLVLIVNNFPIITGTTATVSIDLNLKVNLINDPEDDPASLLAATIVYPRNQMPPMIAYVSCLAYEGTNNLVEFDFSITGTIPTYVAVADEADRALTVDSFAGSSSLNDGAYSLLKSNGELSWTPVLSSNLPDSPGVNGDYYLYDDGAGNTSWNDLSSFLSSASVYYADTAGSADHAANAGSVDWTDVAGAPTIPDTPDAPVSVGDYVLSVPSSGSSSWVAANYIPTSQKGAASGVATLDSNSKVPVVQSNYLYGKCSTAGATAAKTVTITGYDETTIAQMEGVTVFVAFTNHSTAANPTLNVSGAGAHPIVTGTYQDPMAIDKFTNGLHAFTLVKAADNNYYWWINEGRDTVPEAPTATGTYLMTVNSSGNVSWTSYTPPTAATTGTLSLNVAGWLGNGPYSHAVTVSGTTANSKIDLQPDSTVLAQMTTDGTTALYIENNNGTLTAWAMGAAPTAALSIQYTKTEVA